jgi:hypothetical protein
MFFTIIIYYSILFLIIFGINGIFLLKIMYSRCELEKYSKSCTKVFNIMYVIDPINLLHILDD